MIPAFNASGVLAPFFGSDPTIPSAMSPYLASMSEVADRFATTPARKQIMRGLINYRAALTALGITSGFQFVDGSFVEDCEGTRGLPPSDVDVVTFAYCPPAIPAAQLLATNAALFTPAQTKANFNCDAYFVDLGKQAVHLARDSCYWFGLLSHQRISFLWKGMLVVDMQSDDAVALASIGVNNAP